MLGEKFKFQFCILINFNSVYIAIISFKEKREEY